MRRDPKAGGDELLSAYVDGVSELSPGERRSVEARLAADDGARARAEEAATRDLIGRLRELPPEAGEPDWAALERSIADAVGPAVPRSWWQRFGWRLVIPCATLATAAAVMLLVMRPAAPEEALVTAPPPGAESRPGAALALEEDATFQLWLDGATVEVDLDAGELLDVPWGGDLNEEDLLPASDLAWIDDLDSESLERAERWLADPEGAAPAPAPRPRTRKPS